MWNFHIFVSFPFKETSYLNDRQSGFRKLFSTTTAVLDVSEIILEEMNKNKFVGAVLINLKKAFDAIDHKILLKKLWCYGFQNQTFEWFQGSKIGRSDGLRLVENCNGPTEYTRYKSDRTCSTYTNNIKVVKQELAQ